ncbi:MAG TPA: serine/threonine-protein kinase, partial [Nannocystaceae bacterium]|nr:serine/threonine-protein kinase [Nannocystaceae bacterium]
MSGGSSSGTDPASAESSTAAASLASAATMAADDSASASQSSSILKLGTVLGDRYRIEARIGAGGMGTVYRAEHVAIHKQVAIKVLAGDWGNRPKLVERFMQEARAASLVRHPSVVDITDFGHVAEGLPYFVMEYLEGETIGERIAKRGRLSWAQARPFVLQILGALQAAHEHGVIHRDMKPDNCFIVKDGDGSERVKVLDFGIAKVIAEGTSQQLTQTGAVMGTAAYMSPEQAQSLELDARTDLYSVGVVLFEMLTGRLPFVAQGFLGVLTKHLTEKPPSLRKVAPDAGISAALERVVLRLLAKDRNERYANAAELAAALRAIDERPAATRRAWVMPVTVAAVIALGLVGWRAVERRQQRRADRRAAHEEVAAPV